MIKGRVKLEKENAPFVVIYESTESGIPLKRNGNFATTTSNVFGEYALNIPKNAITFITYQLVGTDKITIPTNKVPLTLTLSSNQRLEEFEIKGKRTYYWLLLLLIPVIYKLSKKK